MFNFQKKPNIGIKTKLINSLVLFGIVAQIFMPILVFADHTKEKGRDWHSKPNYNQLTSEQFDKINEMIKNSQEVKESGYNEIMEKYSSKTKKELLKLKLDQKNFFVPPELEHQSTGGNGCNFSNWTPICLLQRMLAAIGYFFLQISSVALYLASQIFDQSVNLSLSYQTYSRHSATAVYQAWQAARDFVNLLFIFIILIIALSFILQIKDYGSQQVLLKLVMIAVIINFSFFITQQVINFSNSAAMYFKEGVLRDRNAGKPESEKIGLATFFVEKLDPQILLKGYKAEPSLNIAEQNPELNRKVKETLNNPDIGFISILITTIGGIIIILYAAFILYAGAVLLILRTVVLWVLMALAPFALVAEIFPASRGSFTKWKSRLWNEIIFPPMMMFMFYFVAKVINSNFLETYVSRGQAKVGLGSSAIFNYYLILQYVFILILLSYCVFLAKSYGATGAQWVSKQENWLKNKAKNIGKAPVNWTGRAVRRGVAGHIAESIATTENKGLGRFYKVTGLKRGAESIVASERAYAKTTDKRLGSLTSKELASRLNTSFVGGTLTKANMDLIQELQKRGDLEKVSPELMKKMHKYMSGIGDTENVKNIETYLPSLAGEGKSGIEKENAIKKAVQREQADKVPEYLQIESEYMNNDVVEARRKEWGEAHMKKWLEKSNIGDKDAVASLLRMLESYGSEYGAIDTATGTINLEKVSKGLEREKNFSAAKFIDSVEGTAAIEQFIQAGGITGRNIAGASVKAVKHSQGAVEEQAKKDVKAESDELTDLIRNTLTASPADKEKMEIRVAELINTAGIEKITDILSKLNSTQEAQLQAILKSKKDESENKIINIHPERTGSIERIEAFKTMSDKDIEGFDIKKLQNRINNEITSGALTGTADDHINSILDDMATAFSRKQYETLFESGNNFTEKFAERLKNKAPTVDKVPLKNITAYLRTLNKESVAKYFETTPGAQIF